MNPNPNSDDPENAKRLPCDDDAVPHARAPLHPLKDQSAPAQPTSSRLVALLWKAFPLCIAIAVATLAAETQQFTPTPLASIIGQSKLQVSIWGPDDLLIHREASYTITVTNISSATELKDLVVTCNLPKDIKLLTVSGSTPTAGQLADNVLVWDIDSLLPEKSKVCTFSLTVTSPRVTTIAVTATSGKISDNSYARTWWKYPAGVLTEITDDADPVRIGDTVTHTVTITNQGSFRDINTQIRVFYGVELAPLECTAPGAAIDGKVVYLPDGFLKPNTRMSFKIKSKAVRVGLHTARLQFNSSFLPKPVDKHETTHVY